MLEQSSSRILVWATSGKICIYQSIRLGKQILIQMAVSIWKIWDLNKANEPEKETRKKKSQTILIKEKIRKQKQQTR